MVSNTRATYNIWDAATIINNAWARQRQELAHKADLILWARVWGTIITTSPEWQALLDKMWPDTDRLTLDLSWAGSENINLQDMRADQILAIAWNHDADPEVLDQIAKQTKSPRVLLSISKNNWARQDTLDDMINSDYLGSDIIINLARRVSDDRLNKVFSLRNKVEYYNALSFFIPTLFRRFDFLKNSEHPLIREFYDYCELMWESRSLLWPERVALHALIDTKNTRLAELLYKNRKKTLEGDEKEELTTLKEEHRYYYS